MKQVQIVCSVLLFAWLAALSGNVTAASVSDDSGQTLQVPQPVERIISLAPHLTELLFAAGAGEKIIAAVSYSDYPPAAEQIPRIGNYSNLDIERILALQPDLIVAWKSGNPAGQLRQLRQLQLPLYISEPRQLADIADTIEKLGQLAGTTAVANTAAEDFRQQLATLKQRYPTQGSISVFYQIWHEPLMTIGGGHIINEVIELCGGRNVFADIGQLAPQIPVESVLAAAPEVIIASGIDDERPAWLDSWREWPQLPAVKNDQLHSIPPYYLQRHSPRLLRGTQQLCKILQRARYDN